MNKKFIPAPSRLLAASSLFFLGGCAFLQAPDPEPIPKVAKLPAADFFDATANITHGIDLGGTWMVSQVIAGDVVQINSVVPRLDKDGKPILDANQKPVVTFGQPETVRLAGVLVAPPGARGAEGARQTVINWTKVNGFPKTDLKVEQDSVYPTDPAGLRNVQIYFTGNNKSSDPKKDTTGTVFNLNRMLVRSGFAVVDLYQASSIKPEAWLNDEQSARLRIDPTDPKGERIAPIGLWKLGVILGERQASPRTLKKDDTSTTAAPEVIASPTAPGAKGPGGTAPIGAPPTASAPTPAAP